MLHGKISNDGFGSLVRLLSISQCVYGPTTRAWHRAGDECGFHEDRAEDYRLASRFS